MFDINTTLPYWSTKTTTYQMLNAVNQILVSNPQRVIAWITSSSISGLDLFSFAVQPPLTTPTAFLAAGSTLKLVWPVDGILVTMDWYAVNQSGLGNVTVTEVFWRPRPRGG